MPYADLPEPPLTAVIFTSLLAHETDGYDAMADTMEEMARSQPGFLGIESARDPGSRLGITVSYWRSEADAVAWKAVAEHRAAQEAGRRRWYDSYRVRVATVQRAYGHER